MLQELWSVEPAIEARVGSLFANSAYHINRSARKGFGHLVTASCLGSGE